MGIAISGLPSSGPRDRGVEMVERNAGGPRIMAHALPMAAPRLPEEGPVVPEPRPARPDERPMVPEPQPAWPEEAPYAPEPTPERPVEIPNGTDRRSIEPIGLGWRVAEQAARRRYSSTSSYHVRRSGLGHRRE